MSKGQPDSFCTRTLFTAALDTATASGTRRAVCGFEGFHCKPMAHLHRGLLVSRHFMPERRYLQRQLRVKLPEFLPPP